MNNQNPIKETQHDDGFEWNGKWISRESIEKAKKEFYELGGDY